MTYESQYKASDPVQITEEKFWEMLEVLPPGGWNRGDHIEYFYVIERLTGNLVSWFGRVGKTYWELNQNADTPPEVITRKLREAYFALPLDERL